MAKSSLYTEDWFLSRGYTKNADNSYSPPKLEKGFVGQKNGYLQGETETIIRKVIKERVSNVTIIDNVVVISPPKDSVLVIDGLIAGLNSANGLMRLHWAKRKKQKELYETIVAQSLREKKLRQHTGEVTVEYIGYKSRFMDWDNFCSSFKLIGDALVKNKVIVDDNPSVITQFIPSQIKVKQIDQKVVVIIRDK